MPTSRRELLTAACGSLGAFLLHGCGGSGNADAPPPAAPPPPPPPDPQILALQRYLRANAQPDAALPPMAAEIPVISWAGELNSSPTATTLTGGRIHALTDALIGKAIPGFLEASIPGNPLIDGLPCLAYRRTYACKGQPREVRSVQAFRIRTEARIIELAGVVPNGLHTVQTLLVDGMLVPPRTLSASRLPAGGWATGTIRLEFGSRSMRDIWIETAAHLAYVKVGANDQLYPVDDASAPQMTVIGDSYVQMNSGLFGNGGAIALSLATRLGIRKVATDAVGGTGYGNSGTSLGNLNDRLPAHAADNSDIYLIVAGLNDYGDVLSPGVIDWPGRAVFEQSVLGYLQGLRSARPGALLVVTAPFCPVPPMSDSSYIVNATTNSSGSGDFPYKANLFRQCMQQIPGPWIYIDVLMGGGWLNSSGARGAVTNLQWLTGGTPAPGTTSTYKPGNTTGGGGGGFGGIAAVPVIAGGSYSQAPEISVSGGSGEGLLLSTTLNGSGGISAVVIVAPGTGYANGGGLPALAIDSIFEQSPAVLGAPQLLSGINPDGQYPLAAFAPAGTTPDELNNIYHYLGLDMIHPSPAGVEYISQRLARNILDALMAM